MTAPHPLPNVRDRILDAALVVFQNEGFGGFTQCRVAAQAEVRQSHVTYYFPTRADLIEATANRHLDRLSAGLAAARERDPEWGTGKLFSWMASQLTDPTHMRMLLAMIVEGDRDPAIAGVMARGTERVRSAIAAALGGPDAEARARVIQTVAWGLGLYTFANRATAGADLTNATLHLIEEFAR